MADAEGLPFDLCSRESDHSFVGTPCVAFGDRLTNALEHIQSICLAEVSRLEGLLGGVPADVQGGDSPEVRVSSQRPQRCHELQKMAVYKKRVLSLPGFEQEDLAYAPELQALAQGRTTSIRGMTARRTRQSASVSSVTLPDMSRYTSYEREPRRGVPRMSHDALSPQLREARSESLSEVSAGRGTTQSHSVTSVCHPNEVRSPSGSPTILRGPRRIDTGESLAAKCKDKPCFELLPFWKTKVKSTASVRARPSGTQRMSLASSLSPPLALRDPERYLEISSDSFFETVGARARRLHQGMMMQPTSKGCICWDFFGLALILIDFGILSLEMFEPVESAATVAILWVQRLFWTFSIPRCFFVGFLAKDGMVELRPARVARTYVRGWLAFDTLAVFSDWVEAVLTSMTYGSVVRVLKASRVTRMLRIVRLVRMFKIPAIMAELDARMFSERSLLVLGILKISCLFVFASHLVACLWFSIGDAFAENGRSWVVTNRLDGETLFYKYTTSLHWAITQFVGSMSIQPESSMERAFAVSVLICSFVMSAAFVSRITASMTRLQIISGSNHHQLAVLRQYLRNNNLSMKLTARVMRSAQHALDLQARNTPEQDVELLALISEPLRFEIHVEIFEPILAAHPFLRRFAKLCPAAMRVLCSSAAQALNLHAGDMLFACGEFPRMPRMFILMSGTMVYRYYEETPTVCSSEDARSLSGELDAVEATWRKEPSSTSIEEVVQPQPRRRISVTSTPRAAVCAAAPARLISQDDWPNMEEVHKLGERSWACEAALWTTWQHVGDMHATTDCVLVCLSAEGVQDTLLKFSSPAAYSAAYATAFLKSLNTSWNSVRDVFDNAVVEAERLSSDAHFKTARSTPEA